VGGRPPTRPYGRRSGSAARAALSTAVCSDWLSRPRLRQVVHTCVTWARNAGWREVPQGRGAADRAEQERSVPEGLHVRAVQGGLDPGREGQRDAYGVSGA